MEFSSSTLVWASATFAVMALFFIWGFAVARARSRSGIMWGLACALTLVVGLAILYSLGDKVPPMSRDRRASLANDEIADGTPDAPDGSPAEVVIESGATAGRDSRVAESADDRRWRYLAEYHPEVRRAVSAVSLLGEPALGELKAAHLALNDPDLLPVIVQRLGDRYAQSPPSKRNGAAKVSPPLEAPADSQVQNGDDDGDDEPVILDHAPAKPEPARQLAPMQARSSGPASEPASASFEARAAAGPALSPSASRNLAGLAANGVSHGASDQTGDNVEIIEEDDDDADDITAPDPSGEANGSAVGEMPANAAAATNLAAAAGVLSPGPEHKLVTPADLQGARFLETRAGVHLFGLVDGRVFVDRHEARGSLKLAREYVDQLASRRPSA
jgi:hypothetical protein